MKTERRHELKENELAHMLLQAKTYWQEYGSRLLFLIGVVVVVVAVVSITVRSRSTALEDAWQRKQSLEFTNAEEGQKSLETLAKITESTRDPTFVLTSLIDLGDHALRLAGEVETPPDPDLNKVAREAFTKLLDKFRDNPMAFGAANCGLATVEENAFVLDGNLAHRDNARKHLEAVADNRAVQSLPFHRLAADRLQNLDAVFTINRFAAEEFEVEPEFAETETPEAVETAETAPPPAPTSEEEEVEVRILQKVQVQPDGSLKVLETREEPVKPKDE